MDGSDERNARGDEFHFRGFGDNLISSSTPNRNGKKPVVTLEKEITWISGGIVVQVPYGMTPPHRLGISRCCTKHKF
jgi:hypothetical protein